MRSHLRLFLPFFLIVVFLLGSCEKDPNADPNQPLIDQLEFVTDSLINHSRVPGVVALVLDHKRGIDWVYTAGLSDIPNNLPMDPNHAFRIGSNTKTMTGTVLLQLVDEGELSLNDKLSLYYPEYPNADDITIAMLCNMTSGIYDYTHDDLWVDELFNNPSRVWSPEELVDIEFSYDLVFAPGSDWQYSNTNTIIIGMLIEKLTGNSLQTEVENRIIQPMQLDNTGLITTGYGLTMVALKKQCDKFFVSF